MEVDRSTHLSVPLAKKEKALLFYLSLDKKQKVCHKVQYVQTGYDFFVLPKPIRFFQPRYFPFKHIHLYDYIGTSEE